MRGYFGIGIENGKNRFNYGSLCRTAMIFNANFIFIIGKRFERQPSDTMASWKHVPTYNYINFDHMYSNIPYDCVLVGIELTDKATQLSEFQHPERAVYLLGAEDNGLTPIAMTKCHKYVRLPGEKSLNVSVAGSIVLYDRIAKLNQSKSL